MDSPNYVYLKDICTVNQGLQIPISKRYQDNGINRYFYITIQFLKDNMEDRTYIENPPESTICRKDDILVTRTGSTGKIVTNIEGCFHNNFFKVNYNKEKIDGRYLYYCLTSQEKQREMKLRSGITTIPDLNHFMFLDMKIPYFNIVKQEKISTVLDGINNKIELNNKINQKLEAMAKTLYDYWFVQFDFPDANGKPYKSSGGKMVYSEELKREIPEGWKVRILDDYADITKGSLITRSQTINGNIKVVSAGVSYSYLHSESNRKENTITISASGANAGYINFWREPIFACDCTTIRGNTDIETIMILHYLYLHQEYIYSQAKGSAQPHVYPSDIKEINYLIPSNGLIENYKNIVISANQKIGNNEKETQKLTQLRDWLLPMLMNGQVTVADAKEQIDELMVAEPSVGYGQVNAMDKS